MRLTPSDADYPESLRHLSSPPRLTVSGPLDAERTVAIVGSRTPLPDAHVFAGTLARALARAGVTIVSGGAKGIDAAAHLGALEVGGTTWVVCGTGQNRIFPPEHERLFASVAAAERSRMIWPFDDDVEGDASTFRARNGVLVALANAVVVIQAKLQSGSRNAAAWARSLGRPLWVVPGLPWSPYVERFGGSAAELHAGARCLSSMEELFRELELELPWELRHKDAYQPRKKKGGRPPALPFPLPDEALSGDERAVFSSLSLAPTHLDQIVQTTGLTVGSAVTALLTLSMKDVVVEGPDGFFRRRTVR